MIIFYIIILVILILFYCIVEKNGIQIQQFVKKYFHKLQIYEYFENKNLPLTGYNMNYTPYYYDSNNYNVEYHNNSFNNNSDYSAEKGTLVKNNENKLEYIYWKDIHNYPIYYNNNSYIYGPSNFVPSYEDSMYMKYNKKNNKKYYNSLTYINKN